MIYNCLALTHTVTATDISSDAEMISDDLGSRRALGKRDRSRVGRAGVEGLVP